MYDVTKGKMLDRKTGYLVVFGMGTEFLVCKKEKVNHLWHIWLREIRTGFGTNSVLWVDDELFERNKSSVILD